MCEAEVGGDIYPVLHVRGRKGAGNLKVILSGWIYPELGTLQLNVKSGELLQLGCDWGPVGCRVHLSGTEGCVLWLDVDAGWHRAMGSFTLRGTSTPMGGAAAPSRYWGAEVEAFGRASEVPAVV